MTQAQALEKVERKLLGDLVRFHDDPLGFVRYAFPWGEGELKDRTIRAWQEDYLTRLAGRIRKCNKDGWNPIQEATCSGHGIGKSALLAWLMLWSMSTRVDTRGVVTAGKQEQLKTKTWPELAKWYRLSINQHWFRLESESFHSVQPQREKTWRFDMVSYSEKKAQTVAGLHNEGKRLMLLFDEASMIPGPIWEVMGGALTDEDTEIIWGVYGNPTRNSGDFRECWGRMRHRWSDGKPLSIDSRDVEGTNKDLFKKWVEDYGEDSDYVRVRVRGMFPRASSLQYINSELVRKAMEIPERYNIDDPLIMSLDIARGGDDNNVISFRHGLDMRSRPQIVVPGSETRDTGRFVDLVVETVEREKPEVVFGDATGVGGPVLDRLRRLGINVIDVQFGAASPDPKYANMRAFIAARFKLLLEQGLALENNPYLESEITSIEYTHDIRDRLMLERKEHMKERGLASPDRFDSACMCCLPYHGRAPISHVRGAKRTDREKGVDYDPFG